MRVAELQRKYFLETGQEPTNKDGYFTKKYTQWLEDLHCNEGDLYYIQNGYVGNAVAWWREGNCGYTTNITEAGRYTKEKANSIIRRHGDIAWLCKYIDENVKARKTIIDFQYLDSRYKYINKID